MVEAVLLVSCQQVDEMIMSVGGLIELLQHYHFLGKCRFILVFQNPDSEYVAALLLLVELGNVRRSDLMNALCLLKDAETSGLEALWQFTVVSGIQ